jgi:hypothetical protein
VSLAHGIVDDLLDTEYFLRLCVSQTDIARKDYILNRLSRLTDFLPELEDEVREKLRLGRIRVDEDVKKYEVELEAVKFARK